MKINNHMHIIQYKLLYIQQQTQTYRIASNYGRSRINAWSRLVAGGNSVITKINAGYRINTGSFVGPQ